MATEKQTSEVEYQQSLTKLFEAMDIVMAKNLQELAFDKTVKCSITDDSNSDKGEYTVTDGSSTFKAYSESVKYATGSSVYVTIPNGDYNNKKLITGRYDQDRSDFNINDPEKSYIDITQNLVTNFDGEKGLIANGEVKQITLWDSGPHFGYQLDKKDDVEGTADSGYKAYKKMFVSGKFKSWLSRRNVLLGNYGIRVDILVKKENTSSQTVEDWYMYKLDSSDMMGDPYKFEVGFEQKIIFDLDPEVTIDRVRLVFYQDANFYDKSKQYMVCSATDDLFVSEPFVSFGYSFEDFTEDTVLLYTFNSNKYAEYLTEGVKKTIATTSTPSFDVSEFDKPEFYKSKLDELNKKKIILRWVHEKSEDDGQGFTAIGSTEDVPETAIVHWYKYNLAEGTSDPIAGAFWEEMEDQKNKFELVFTPDTSASSQLFKVIIENYSSQYVQDFLIANDNDIIDIEVKKEEERTDEEKETLTNLKNAHLENIHRYSSEILTFENENRVPDQDTIDLIKGLTITCDDGEGGYNGVYRIYNDNGEIMSVSESSKKRILTASYTSLVTGMEKLDTAEKIIWSIPLENTMIYPPTEGTEYSFYDKVDKLSQEEFKEQKLEYFTYDYTTLTYKKATSWSESETYYTPNKTEISIEEGYFTISRYGVAPSSEAGTEEADSTQQYFRIKDYYTQSAINNTVYCQIIKNNRIYRAEFNMVFGPCGTNGTDFTFTLEFENKQPAVTCTDKTVTIIPRIYDYQNKDVTNQYIKNISYSWYSSNTEYASSHDNVNAISIGQKDAETGAIELTLNSHDMTELNYFILCGKVSDIISIQDLKTYNKDNVDGDIDDSEEEVESINSNDTKISLFSYLPIPVRRTAEYITFDGANKISYDTSGVNPQYYQDSYMVYQYVNGKTSSIPSINWMMSFGKDTQAKNTKTTSLKYYPTLDSNNKLVPTAMYIQENGKQVSVIGYTTGENGIQFEWIQPLYIYQNSFTSSMLNSWDGSLTLDKENGTILSTMMGAGKKDSNNRFNGVLMGDLSPAFNNANESIDALKDYYNGIGLYGFNEGQKSFGLNINGRAFFGRSGKGQILIDGNSGTIQSQHFLASMSGYYSKVDGDKKEPSDTAKEGMKIDLDNGILEAYGINSTAMIKIDPTAGSKGEGPYFIIRSAAGENEDSDNELDQQAEAENPNGVELFYVGKKKYFLQSHNYTTKSFKIPVRDEETNEIKYEDTIFGRGLKFDLMKGSLKGYDFSLKSTDSSTGAYVELNSEGSLTKPYLRIHGIETVKNTDGQNIVANVNDIVHFSKDKQRICSIDYNSDAENGTLIDLGEGKIVSYTFNLKAIKEHKGIQLSSSGDPFLRIKTLTDWGSEVNLINVTNNAFILKSKNFNTNGQTGTDGKEIDPQGIEIDFVSNTFKAYSFKLEARGFQTVENSDGTTERKRYTFLLDSTQEIYPLQIGTRFKVGWSGEIIADYIKAEQGGKIGCFYIDSTCLYTNSKTFGSSGIYLGNDGVSVGPSSQISSSGQAIFSNIDATGGKVGGWTLGVGTFTNGNTVLSNKGLYFGGNYLYSDKLKFGSVLLDETNGLKIGDSITLDKTNLLIDTNIILNTTGLYITGEQGNIKITGAMIQISDVEISGKQIKFGNCQIYDAGGIVGFFSAPGQCDFTISDHKFGGSMSECLCSVLTVTSRSGDTSTIGGDLILEGNLIVGGEKAYTGTKAFGKLAYEDYVSKKVNVTLTGPVQYSGNSAQNEKTVYAHLDGTKVTLNEDPSGAVASYKVKVTANAPGGTKNVTLKATGCTLKMEGSSSNATATLTNSDFSNVSFS